MNINFTARHAKITSDIEKYCERRLRSIEKLLGYELDADLILSIEKYRHKVEINIKTKGATLNTVEETQDMLSSIGVAFDNIEKRVKKEREKLRERKRRKNKEIGFFSLPVEEKKRQRKIIKSSDYSLKPMSIDEALSQFESSKKEIFVFRGFDSDKWTILFRRKDGNYGLLELE